MIDLHTHTFFSDGELGPAELVRRAVVKGYRAIALTDHADASNIHILLKNLIDFKKSTQKYLEHIITIVVGVELTHVPPEQIKELVEYARGNGAEIVVMHGETIVEPVEENTNKKAIEAKVDILAHPGLITEELVKQAIKNEVYLEITTRRGHSLCNGHVASLAKKYGLNLVINTDTHSPSDLITLDFAKQVLQGAGLSTPEVLQVFKNSENLLKKILH